MNRIAFVSTLVLFLFCTGCFPNKMSHIKDSENVLISINKKVGSLTFLDPHDLHKVADWDLNRDVSGAALLQNEKDIAVYHPVDPNIDIYHLSTGEKVKSWKAGVGITNMISLKSNHTIAVTNGKKNTITFFDQKGIVLKQLNIGKNPISMVEDTTHHKLFVSLFNERKVININLDNYKVEQTIEVPNTSIGLILNNDASELFVGGHGNGESENEDVKVYSTTTGKKQKSLHTPLMPISFFKNDDGLFTIAHGTNQIYKLDPTVVNQTKFIEVGSNPYAAIGFKHSAYAASYDLNKLYQINTKTMKIEKEAAVGRGPFQLLLREGIRHE
ncbi:YncE family protein [Gottfriedia sp. NPDC056225]|uniref:YncE family protein n=1 Tax=Gottfriedia sp. NPDC056225 TaxID=3345751 RepID=UPI0035DE9739